MANYFSVDDLSPQEQVNYFIPLSSQNQNDSVASLFEARKFYENYTIPFITGSYLDLIEINDTTLTKIPFSNLYNQNSFFGLVDLDADITAPINDQANFKKVGVKNGNTIVVQNFVADAFSDMVEYINKQIVKNVITQDSPFYNMSAVKGYTNIDNLYALNLVFTLDSFKKLTRADKSLDTKITNFKDFNKEYIKFLKKFLVIRPVTKTRTVAYYNLDVFTSGLAIKFAEDDPGDDVNKYVKYFLDPGFVCFSEACIRFGFKFDKNIPYILLADLNSPAMLKYYEKYNIKSTKEMFSKRFRKIYKEDLEALKNGFLGSYNYFIANNEVYGEDLHNICAADARMNRYKTRLPTSAKEYYKEYPDTYWIRLYTYFKNYELNYNLTQQQFENLVRIAVEYVKLGKTSDGMAFLNSRFNELSGINYYDSLLVDQNVVEDKEVGSLPRNEIIF